MNSTITFINEKFVEFEKEIKKTEKRRDIKLENSYLTKRREEMDALLVRLEQYYRRRLQWIEDSNELSIRVIKEHMNQKIKPEDINMLHRLWNPKNFITATHYSETRQK